MLSQREIFDVAIKLFGSLKLIARHLEIELDELETYFLEAEEMPLRVYSDIHSLIENEMEANLELFLQADGCDFLSLKRTRQKLGLSLQAMAKTLGLGGQDSVQLVRLMENGNISMIGPVGQLVRYLGQIALSEKMPYWSKFLVCQPLPRKERLGDNLETVMHTAYPRFVAKPVETFKVRNERHAVTLNRLQSLMVVIWIDAPEVVDDEVIRDCLLQAGKVYERRERRHPEQPH